MEQINVILLFSGKRKCGKDYLCERLKFLLEEKCTILRISGPLKHLYAKKHGLELKELMNDGPYKEKFRMDMIIWSDKVRKEQPGYFCKAACDASIDDVQSECDLDDYSDWDFVLSNNNKEELEEALKKLLDVANEYL